MTAAEGSVHVFLHGPAAPAHEHHTGEPGSFTAALAALADAQRTGTHAFVSTWLTRSSFRVLGDIVPILTSRGVAAWCIEVAQGALAPRLALAVPYALHAVDRARTLGVPAWTSGAPLCLLGPHAAWALPSEPRSYGAPCAECAARGACSGVDAEYLARFHADELRPRRAPTSSRAPDDLAVRLRDARLSGARARSG